MSDPCSSLGFTGLLPVYMHIHPILIHIAGKKACVVSPVGKKDNVFLLHENMIFTRRALFILVMLQDVFMLQEHEHFSFW